MINPEQFLQRMAVHRAGGAANMRVHSYLVAFDTEDGDIAETFPVANPGEQLHSIQMTVAFESNSGSGNGYVNLNWVEMFHYEGELNSLGWSDSTYVQTNNALGFNWNFGDEQWGEITQRFGSRRWYIMADLDSDDKITGFSFEANGTVVDINGWVAVNIFYQTESA